MEPPDKDRRKISYAATVDSAIRSASQMFASKDSMTRSAANRIISDLQRLRNDMPTRRMDDGKYDSR